MSFFIGVLLRPGWCRAVQIIATKVERGEQAARLAGSASLRAAQSAAAYGSVSPATTAPPAGPARALAPTSPHRLRSSVSAIASISSRAGGVRGAWSSPLRRSQARCSSTPRRDLVDALPDDGDGRERPAASRRLRAAAASREHVRRSRATWSAPSRSALLTTYTSPISRMPALAAWMPSPMPGREQHERGVGQAAISTSRLPDADGLDQDHVAAGGVEDPQRLRRRPGQAAEVAARRHRPDVDALVGVVVLHPDPVAEQGAARER